MLSLKPGSPQPGGSSKDMKPIEGIPRVAVTTMFNAPVHIDVGGTIYTSSLETLTAYPDSRLSKMFNGVIPIVLDTLKQHYFIDRDGEMFQHVLNFMRNKELILPNNYPCLDLLLQEAQYFELKHMVLAIYKLKKEQEGVSQETEWFAQAREELRRESDLIMDEQTRMRQRWSS